MESSVADEVEALAAIFGSDLRLTHNADAQRRELRLGVPLGAVEESGWGGVEFGETLWAEVVVEVEGEGGGGRERVWVGRRRDLSEAEAEGLGRAVEAALADRTSLYDVFSAAEAFLAALGKPETQCCVCLCRLGRPTKVALTPCAHAFHPACLASCVAHQREEVGAALRELPAHLQGTVDESLRCPLCRSVLRGQLAQPPPAAALALGPDAAEASAPSLDAELGAWREKQEALSELFARQLGNGGIIDLEEERRRGRVDEDTRLLLPPPPPPPDEPSTSQPDAPRPPRHRRRNHKGRGQPGPPKAPVPPGPAQSSAQSSAQPPAAKAKPRQPKASQQPRPEPSSQRLSQPNPRPHKPSKKSEALPAQSKE